MTSRAILKLKRVYEKPAPDDGYRVLVDRLWPRGETHEAADADVWLKEIGPTNELRKWFGHDPAKFDEFKQRYVAELDDNPAVDELQKILDEHPVVTLLFGAKNTEDNQAVVLQQYMEARQK